MVSKLVISALFILFVCNAWALPQSIVIEEQTVLASQPVFGREDYHLGALNPGSKAEIISISTQHEHGVSFQVRSTEGANRGQVGWVYLSSDEAKRKFSVLDEKNNEVSLPHIPSPVTNDEDDSVLEHLGTLKRVNNPTNNFKRAFIPLTKSMTPAVDGVYSKIPELVSVKSDKSIWDDFASGKLKLDEESYKGGNIFTFTDESGSNKYHAAFKPEYLGSLPENIQEIVKVELDCDETPTPSVRPTPQVQAALPGQRNNWLPGCDVLSGRISENSKNKLDQCLNSIKQTLSGGKRLRASDRTKVFPLFYSKLNPTEQEFLGHIVTSIGEAGVLAPPIEEMVAIMMILENRKDYAKSKGFSNANVLDAALQPSQFSMYNRGAHHWSDALNRENSDNQTQHALDAFIKLKNTTLTPTLRRVYHYHTNSVHPDWKTPSKVVPITLNGVSLRKSGKRHIFYRDIGWSFRNNPWSNK